VCAARAQTELDGQEQRRTAKEVRPLVAARRAHAQAWPLSGLPTCAGDWVIAVDDGHGSSLVIALQRSVIHHARSAGPVAARNTGARAAPDSGAPAVAFLTPFRTAFEAREGLRRTLRCRRACPVSGSEGQSRLESG
jgi:hypothetical protein